MRAEVPAPEPERIQPTVRVQTETLQPEAAIEVAAVQLEMPAAAVLTNPANRHNPGSKLQTSWLPEHPFHAWDRDVIRGITCLLRVLTS